jgi:uncharacterized protein YxjI
MRQRITMMVNRYELYLPAAPGTGSKEEGELVAFVEQKRMKLKEEITFWRDRTKNAPLFTIKAEKAFDPSGTYMVLNPEGAVIARFKKDFAKSFARSTYHLQDAAGNVTGMAQERNLGAALFRRYGSLVPYLGDLLGLIPIAYNFDFFSNDGTQLAVVERLWSIRDRFRITISDPVIDRRLVLGLAVCMDALQAR